MDRRKFRIEANELAAKDVYRLELKALEGPALEIRAGQFVDIEIPGYYLRRPIAVCDFRADSLCLYYKTVGEGTKTLSKMQCGAVLDLLTGLGSGFSTSACKESALLVGGGLGCGCMYLLARQLLSEGKQVTVVQCFNSAEDIVLEREFEQLGVRSVVATLDGSRGVKGFATDAIEAILEKPVSGSGTAGALEGSGSDQSAGALEGSAAQCGSTQAGAPLPFDFFYTCGPMPMMRSICESLSISGQASLEERMGCGAGYCYGCSRHSKSGTKRICKDGPVFPKEEIIW